MSTVRITADLRDGIIANALRQRFAAENLVIEEQQAQVKTLTEARDKAGYEAAFSVKDRARLAEAPEGWFPTDTKVKVAVEETNEVIEVTFAKAHRVPYEVHDNRFGTHIASIIKPDHPYMAARASVKLAKEELQATRARLDEARGVLRTRVKAVVESVTTVARLVEVWPEVTELLPEIYSGPKAGLPAGLISDLNSELGLVKEA